MKDQKTEDRMNRKRKRWKPKHVRVIPIEIVWQSFKMDPAEDERKGDGDGDDAAPHDQHVRAPAKFSPLKNEQIQTEVARYFYKPFLDIPGQVSRSQENLPTSLPVKRGRGTLQPH